VAAPAQLTSARARRTRAALLTAARELIEELGFEALTMAAVADRAGVTRRSLYLHFASRAELVSALFDHVVESADLAASTAGVWAAPDSVTALEEWARHLARFHPRVMATARAIEHVHRVDPDAATHRQRYLREQYAACRKLAAWLEREGRLAAPWTVESAADMLFALIAVDLFERLLEERHWSSKRLADRLAALLRATFVTSEVDAEHGRRKRR
jgi:AcrR family transcriptional regulator